jgi:hypothetical protein
VQSYDQTNRMLQVAKDNKLPLSSSSAAAMAPPAEPYRPPHAPGEFTTQSIQQPGQPSTCVAPPGVRLAVHYYFLPGCPHCVTFRRDVWEPLVLTLKKSGILFHEINADTYDGMAQARKHGISRFPSVTWSKMGPNHPQFILRNNNENKDQLIEKIQVLLMI